MDPLTITLANSLSHLIVEIKWPTGRTRWPGKKRQIICGRGLHVMAAPNLVLYKDKQGRTCRQCKACRRAAQRARYRRKQAAKQQQTGKAKR